MKLNRLHKAKGFALIATLSLMILLVLIALGMLSISTIALRSSQSGNAKQEAQANARLALMLAIGQLQKELGPDQRISVTANMSGTADGEELAAGDANANIENLDETEKGLTAVQDGTRYWTGVAVANDDPDQIYSKTPSATVSKWLVSGNETNSVFSPDDSRFAVGQDGSLQNPDEAILLAGENTLGNGSVEGYVAVPSLEISSVTGQGSDGRYAWWVSDEGMKARINVTDSASQGNDFAALAPERGGWENIQSLADYPLPGTTDEDIAKLVSLKSLDLLLPNAPAGVNGETPRQEVFHAATPYSYGVIADTLRGGTRIDLSTVFENGLSTTDPGLATINNYPLVGERVIPQVAAADLDKLTWDVLADFYDQREDIANNGYIEAREATDELPAISPLLIDFRILFGIRQEGVVNATSFKFHPCGKIAVTLANPYSETLRWDEPLEIELFTDNPPNWPSAIWQLRKSGQQGAFFPNSGSSAVFNNMAFQIPAGELAPGEARAFTHANLSRPYTSATSRAVVQMDDTSSLAIEDFGDCVEMERTLSTNVGVNGLAIHVREGTATTPVIFQMRFGENRDSKVLTEVNYFEMDTAEYLNNNRTFTRTTPSSEPYPLFLISYQFSQPAQDYLSLMPSGSELGQRSSAVRVFADFNLAADSYHNPISSYTAAPYFFQISTSAADFPDLATSNAGDTGSTFTKNIATSPVQWGSQSTSGGSLTNIFFDVPQDLISLAQFQHADLTNDAVKVSVGHQPGYAFGNSYAPPSVKRSEVERERTDYTIQSPDAALETLRKYYDISHLLNSSLWDNYFLSSVDQQGTFLNPNMVSPSGTALGSVSQDPVEVTSELLLRGAFNVNSTDKDAWKAFLGSTKHFGQDQSFAESASATFPRSLALDSDAIIPPSGEGIDSYGTFRRLSDSELDSLAEEIVKQVRRRGPFVSLSHFVNRAIADISDENELSRSGALQYAIDESGINISYEGNDMAFTALDISSELVTLSEKNGAPRADLDGASSTRIPSTASNAVGVDFANSALAGNTGSIASIIADREILTDSNLEREQGYRSTSMPSWLTQADILQVIGPNISTRSDTFRIRAYGDSRSSNGQILAKAYCEAVVQRMPDYISLENGAEERGSQLSQTNSTFGRQFAVISFKWLSPDEI
ncbi:MAG: hypothetical protein ACSHX7_13070 [Luteolibacter sp.]